MVPQVLMAHWSSLAMATEVCFWGSPYIALSLLAMTHGQLLSITFLHFSMNFPKALLQD